MAREVNDLKSSQPENRVRSSLIPSLYFLLVIALGPLVVLVTAALVSLRTGQTEFFFRYSHPLFYLSNLLAFSVPAIILGVTTAWDIRSTPNRAGWLACMIVVGALDFSCLFHFWGTVAGMFGPVSKWHELNAIFFPPWLALVGLGTYFVVAVSCSAFLQLMRGAGPHRPLSEFGPNCPQCGYCVFGITSNQCPECGSIIPRSSNTD